VQAPHDMRVEVLVSQESEHRFAGVGASQGVCAMPSAGNAARPRNVPTRAQWPGSGDKHRAPGGWPGTNPARRGKPGTGNRGRGKPGTYHDKITTGSQRRAGPRGRSPTNAHGRSQSVVQMRRLNLTIRGTSAPRPMA